MLTAEKFDAAEWAQLFKDAGARFVMPVAEHHDGFPMYDSDLTEWCASKMGPKRDICGELADAVREQDMVFAVSSHRAEHWWFFDGGRALPLRCAGSGQRWLVRSGSRGIERPIQSR